MQDVQENFCTEMGDLKQNLKRNKTETQQTSFELFDSRGDCKCINTINPHTAKINRSHDWIVLLCLFLNARA